MDGTGTRSLRRRQKSKLQGGKGAAPGEIMESLSAKKGTKYDEVRCCFGGANEELEIEDYAEFLSKVKDKDVSHLSSYGDWIFQEVDFSSETESSWEKYNFSDCWFWGCTLPTHETAEALRRKGAQVNENPPDLPFKPFRAFMYRMDELVRVDESIFQFYLEKKDLRSTLYEAAHDYSMNDALHDYLEGKAVIAFMGGHAMERHSPEFAQVVWLAWRLSRVGYVVASGGGPGAMAAANMGAYLSQCDVAGMKKALELISNEAGNDLYEKSYLNPVPEQAVLDYFGKPSHMPSLAIPTWRYGHEPSNRFATYYAKYFSNAIREDALIDVAHGGILYFPGSAGTRQEIFQAACFNHYAEAKDVTPMVFVDSRFWTNPPVFQLFQQLAKGRPFHRWLLLCDDIEDICDHFLSHANEQKLPLFQDFAKLKEAHWMK